MPDKFLPADKTLDPIARVLAKSSVSKGDVEQAIEDWKKKPPDKEFKNILEPELDNTL